MNIGMIVTEISADKISAEVVKALYQKQPTLSLSGMTGNCLKQTNCQSLWDIEQLSVMGISDILKKIYSIIKLRNDIIKHFTDKKIDVFIGVDGPDFNLTIAKKLKKKGIKTIHFISPSVWAWRQYRVKKIKQSIDLMICIFPFEVAFYQKHGITAQFVGHPLADVLSPRKKQPENYSIALLPGSRDSEIKHLLPLMIASAKQFTKIDDRYKFIIALVNDSQLKNCKAQIKGIASIKIVVNQTYDVLRQAKLAVITSGTATLEACLIGVPMVVVYKTTWLNYFIFKQLINIPYIALPNILANKLLVPELIQDNATVTNVCIEMKRLLNQSHQSNQTLIKAFYQQHQQLQQNSANHCADLIINSCSV